MFFDLDGVPHRIRFRHGVYYNQFKRQCEKTVCYIERMVVTGVGLRPAPLPAGLGAATRHYLDSPNRKIARMKALENCLLSMRLTRTQRAWIWAAFHHRADHKPKPAAAV